MLYYRLRALLLQLILVLEERGCGHGCDDYLPHYQRHHFVLKSRLWVHGRMDNGYCPVLPNLLCILCGSNDARRSAIKLPHPSLNNPPDKQYITFRAGIFMGRIECDLRKLKSLEPVSGPHLQSLILWSLLIL